MKRLTIGLAVMAMLLTAGCACKYFEAVLHIEQINIESQRAAEANENLNYGYKVIREDGRQEQLLRPERELVPGTVSALIYTIYAVREEIRDRYVLNNIPVTVARNAANRCEEAPNPVGDVENINLRQALVRASMNGDVLALDAAIRTIGALERPTLDPDGLLPSDEEVAFLAAQNLLREFDLLGPLNERALPNCAGPQGGSFASFDGLTQLFHLLADTDLGTPGLWQQVQEFLPQEEDILQSEINFILLSMPVPQRFVDEYKSRIRERFILNHSERESALVDNKESLEALIAGHIALPYNPVDYWNFSYVVSVSDRAEDGSYMSRNIYWQRANVLRPAISETLYNFWTTHPEYDNREAFNEPCWEI